MPNFLKQIESYTAELGEKPEKVVIGNYYFLKPLPKEYINTPKDWSDVSYLFDYQYSDGFGGAECHPVYIYTKSFVVFVGEYDGSTSLEHIPRNPQDCEPKHI